MEYIANRKAEYATIKRAAQEAIALYSVPTRVVCPICGGGSDKEECLSLWSTNTNAVYATCHRAQCGVGTVRIEQGQHTPDRADTQADAREWDYRYKSHAEQWSRTDKGELSWATVSGMYPALKNCGVAEKIRHRWAFRVHPSDSTRFLMPMRDSNGKERGVISRQLPLYKGNGAPKSLTFKDKDYDGMSWYTPNTAILSEAIWAVEDPASAIVLAMYGVDAVSLNGTNLNYDRVSALRDRKWTIKLALDADATRQAIRHAMKYKGSTKLEVVRLVKDVKDMKQAEVEELLQGRGETK